MHDKTYGWLLFDGSEDSQSACGTWVHPKTYSQAYEAKKNSAPVQVFNEILVKVGSYTLQLDVSEV